MTETHPDPLCDRCAVAVPEGHRTRLAIRPPRSPEPVVRHICGRCAWGLVDWLQPPRAEVVAEVLAEGDAVPNPPAENLDVSRTI